MKSFKNVPKIRRDDLAELITDEARLRSLLIRTVKYFMVVFALFVVVYTIGQRGSHVADKNIPASGVVSAEAAVRANPNDITARLTLADAYAQVKRTKDALAQLQEVLKAVPDNRSALLGVGAILYEQGKYDDAKKYLQKFTDTAGTGEFSQSDTQLQRAYYILGLIALKQNDADVAVEALSRALAIESGDADALYALGNAWVLSKKYDSAIKSYQQALAFVPTGWCEPYKGLATAYGQTKDDQGQKYASAMSKVCGGAGTSAAAPLKTLLEGKFRISAMLGLGAAAENDRDFTTAADWYRKVLKEEPTNLAAKGGLLSSGGGHAGMASPTASPSTEAQ